jgi:aminoglycoside phosphotransferase (APT) family kinase protein
MAVDVFEAVPESHREPARAAVESTFGRALPTDVEPLRGGASGALMYRMRVDDRGYVLRLETGRDIFRDPARSYVCLRTAADAGIAPPLLHADTDAGVVIMELIDARPLQTYEGGPARIAADLGALIGRLQAAPPFPTFAPYPLVISGMLTYVRDAGVFADGLLDRHAEGLARISSAYPWDDDSLVSSHNDLATTNVLFDGDRLWLVDWELAFRNDPLSDVANLSHYVAGTPALEDALLRGWLGRDPDDSVRARFTLMQQLTRLFTACLVLGASVGQREQDTDLDAPTLAEFRDQVVSGARPLSAAETRHVYGKVFLAAFLRGLSEPTFETALATEG